MTTGKKKAAPPTERYPEPVPVITGTAIGYDANDPFRILLVKARRFPRQWVFPGGIFDVHEDATAILTARRELREETGFQFYEHRWWHFGTKWDRVSDRREFCGVKTVHCCDYLVAGPIERVGKILDTAEVKGIAFQDVREKKFRGEYKGTYALGHESIAKTWLQVVQTAAQTGSPLQGFGSITIEV